MQLNPTNFHNKEKKFLNLNKGGIARGCGAVAENKRKKTTIKLMAKKGLRAWVKEKWVDIGSTEERRKISTLWQKRSAREAKENIRNAYHLQKPHG